jgi:hydrogenase maturation protease
MPQIVRLPFDLSSPLPSSAQEDEGETLSATLVIGYGNPDREDDGVGWHLLDRLARRLDPLSGGMGDETWRSFNRRPDLLFSLQLMPEMAETVAEYDRVLFIDAHTGDQPEDVAWQWVEPQFQASPFTHHLTPATLLSMVQTLYGRQPEAVLVAVRGYQFGFERSLSVQTLQHIQGVEPAIWDWLQS